MSNDSCTDDEWNEQHYVRIHNLIQHLGNLLDNAGRLVEIAVREGRDVDARRAQLKFLVHEMDDVMQASVVHQLTISRGHRLTAGPPAGAHLENAGSNPVVRTKLYEPHIKGACTNGKLLWLGRCRFEPLWGASMVGPPAGCTRDDAGSNPVASSIHYSRGRRLMARFRVRGILGMRVQFPSPPPSITRQKNAILLEVRQPQKSLP